MTKSAPPRERHPRHPGRSGSGKRRAIRGLGRESTTPLKPEYLGADETFPISGLPLGNSEYNPLSIRYGISGNSDSNVSAYLEETNSGWMVR